MAKTITKLKSQKPSWIAVDEPVSGSTDPANQDSTVQADGTVTYNVEGVDNRVEAQLWGLLKLLADIVDNEHGEDGSHELSNFNIAADASIDEAKLNLDFEGEDSPDGSTYSSTTDIINMISELWPYREVAVKSAHFNQLQRETLSAAISGYLPVFWNDFESKLNLGGRQDSVKVAKKEIVYIGSNKVTLNSSNNVDSASNDCYIDLGEAKGFDGTPAASTTAKVVTLEIWDHDITDSGIGFYFGNTQYTNTENASGDNGLDFPHTSDYIETGDSGFEDFIMNSDNNVFINRDSGYSQWVYAINNQFVDYTSYKWGCDDPSFRTLYGGKSVTPSSRYKGCWESEDDEVLVIPMMIIVRRNAGIHDTTLNPAGQAIKRSGISEITSFSDCFYHEYIAYMDDSGSECPDYAAASFSSSSDTYSLDGVTYYRSGTVESNVNSSFLDDKYIEDIVPESDILQLKKAAVDRAEAVSVLEQMILNGIYDEFNFNRTIYGTVSSTANSTVYSNKVPQIIGFGDSESNIFGPANIGGVLVDVTNNGNSGLVDECRKCWIDKETEIKVSFSFTQGDSDSESKPSFLSYEPSTRTVSLNSTSLSSEPTISSNMTPILIWENGDEVVLSDSWSGLGSSTANCIINSSDHSDHSGQKVYGMCKLSYSAGSGVPFILSDVKKVEDIDGNEYPFLDHYFVEEHTELLFNDVTGDGSTTSEIILSDEAFTSDDYYTDNYLTVLGTGETAKITSYDGSTRKAYLDSSLASSPSADTRITIDALEDDCTPHIFINSHARGVNGNVKRKRFQATSDGVVLVGSPIYSVSTGSDDSEPEIRGTIIDNLNPSEFVDVLYETDDPFNEGFLIHFTNTQSKQMFGEINSSDNYTIEAVGNLFSTNIGSANYPYNAYQLFIPTSTIPAANGTKWVGSSDGSMITSNTKLDNISWSQIVPFPGVVINGSDMTATFKYFNDSVYLTSFTQVVDDNSGCHVGFLLTKSESTGRDILLVGVNYSGNFGFDSDDYVFTLEVNKTFVVKD